jgi:hypothetical protein
MFDQAVYVLVIEILFYKGDIRRCNLVHLVLEQGLEQRQILDYRVHFITVK